MTENVITELTMLGTGNATVTRCYNTCFTIKTGKNILLVDAGGGNGILGQLEKAGICSNRYRKENIGLTEWNENE